MTASLQKNLATLAGLLLLLLALFHFQGNMEHTESHFGRSAFRWMTGRWQDKVAYGNVDYSHGFLIPLVSLWFLWERRRQIAQAPKRAYIGGLILLSAALVLHVLGMRVAQTRVSLTALILCLWALPLLLYGPAVARLALFPAAYLIFCIPLNFLNALTFPLRLFAAVAASALLNGLGIEAIRSGSRIYSTAGAGFDFNVADPCSGLRSILAITALTAAYAWLTQRGLLRKWALLLASIPIAILANVFRIVTVALVAQFFGQKAAGGFYHDFSGYAVFVFVVLIMLATGKLVQQLPILGENSEPAPQPDKEPPASANTYLPPSRLVGFACLLILACLGFCSTLRDVRVADTAGVSLNLPDKVGTIPGISMLYCPNAACPDKAVYVQPGGSNTCEKCGQILASMSKLEKGILPPGTEIARKQYNTPDGRFIQVSVVLSGPYRDSIHRPQRCLIAQGNDIAGSEIIQVPLPGSQPLGVMLLRLAAGASGGQGQREARYAYWFVGGARETPGNLTRMLWMAWDAITRGTMERWAYISVATPLGASSDPAAIERELIAFIADLHPLIRTQAPPAAR